MKLKAKNHIVFSVQMLFFSIIDIMMSIIEILNLIIILDKLLINPSFTILILLKILYHGYKAFFFVMFPFLCLIIADVSLYGFLYKIKILSPDSPRTAPVCTIVTNLAVLNLFLAHYSIYKSRYNAYLLFIPGFTPFILLFNFLTLLPEILLIITFCAIFMNLYFGVENMIIGHLRSKRIDLVTVVFHIIIVINGLLAFPAIFEYLLVYTFELYGFLFSLTIGLLLTGILKLFLYKKQLKYPFEAIELWLGQRKTKNEKKGTLPVQS